MMKRSASRRSSAPCTTATSGRDPFAGIDTPDAFASAVTELLPLLRGVARRLDAGNWEDLTQDTLMRAWRARAQFQPGTSLKAWLLTILRNVFNTNVVRTRQQAPWEEFFGDRLSQGPDQETVLLDADLSAALASLSIDQRAALLSITEDELSYADAAEQLDISVAALKTRIFRARQSVMTFLDEGSFERSAFTSA